MKIAAIAMLTLRLCLTTCFGQAQVRLTDISLAGSPVEVSGTLSFDDDPSQTLRYSNQIVGHLRDKSAKDILLVIVHFRGGGPRAAALDLTFQQEYFFTSDVLQAGASKPFQSRPTRFGIATINGNPVEESIDELYSAPRATAETVFVEFSDGTTWGDLESARDGFKERLQTLNELSQFEGLLRAKGPEALSEQLSKDRFVPECISSLRNTCSGKTSACLSEGVRLMLEAAKLHNDGTQARGR
jgi:hypothetical protein